MLTSCLSYISNVFVVAVLLCTLACKKSEDPVDQSSDVSTFWQKAALPHTRRNEGIVGLLADGRVILTSGYLSNGSSSTSLSTELYDPATDTWTVISDKSPEGSPNGFIRLKSGKMILLNRGSSVVNVFDPVTKQFHSIGQHGGQIGDWLTVSGACELANGKVIISGRSSLTVWDQKQSFVTFSMNSGSSSLRFATVHQLPNTNQFMVLGNSYYQGKGLVYELNANAPYEPQLLTNPPLNVAAINAQSMVVNGKLLLMGGSVGTTVNNAALSPILLDPTDYSLTKVLNTKGSYSGFSMGIPSVIGQDPAGNVWFTDERFHRHKFDVASEKIVIAGNASDSTKVVPSPFTERYISVIILQDGRTLALDKDQAWISK